MTPGGVPRWGRRWWLQVGGDIERTGAFVDLLLRNGLVLQKTWGEGVVEWTHEAVGVHAGRRRQIDFVASRGLQRKACRVRYDVDENSDRQMLSFDSVGAPAEKLQFSRAHKNLRSWRPGSAAEILALTAQLDDGIAL